MFPCWPDTAFAPRGAEAVVDVAVTRAVRRLVVYGVAAVILGGVVAGYVHSSPVLAWQMFPEASTWEAEIVRVTATGDRVDIREAWPGGYVWSDLVDARGLGTPHSEQPASYGVAVVLDTLQHALDWVAANTPQDGETRYLEAVVTHRHNDDPHERTVLRSADRELP